MKTTNNFTLRLPDDLRAKLESKAKSEERTLSNLILKILKDSVSDSKSSN